jgi:hypothetical protein
MSWAELDHKTRDSLPMTGEREALLNEVRKEVRPLIVHEVDQGDKGIEPVEFKEVKSPGLFEAQFGKKYNDVVMHFWPWGFHLAEKRGEPRPAFRAGMRAALELAIFDVYGRSDFVKLSEDEWDREMGAITVLLLGQGAKQFWYELAVKAMKTLHRALGGKE